MSAGLRVLVLDDEAPALDELTWLLRRDPRIGEVHSCDNPADALRMLKEIDVDAVFLDVQMPGLNGIELASVLRRFSEPPAIVFVTAHDTFAIQAFEASAFDYLLKPFDQERFDQTMIRLRHRFRQIKEARIGQSVRHLLADRHDVAEKKMMGGLMFMVKGGMCVVVSGRGGLMVRVGPDAAAKLRDRPHVQPMRMRGRWRRRSCAPATARMRSSRGATTRTSRRFARPWAASNPTRKRTG